MESVDLLKKELKAMNDTTEIIDVMKKIAVSQFRNLENKVKNEGNGYSPLENLLGMVNVTKSSHKFIAESDGATVVVMVTSDEGFLGALNSQVIKKAIEIKGEHKAELIVIGDRGSGYMEDMKESFSYFPGITEDVTNEEVNKIKNYLVRQYAEKKVAKVIFVYPAFISFTHQEVASFQVLPCRHIFPVSRKNAVKYDGSEKRKTKNRRKEEDRRLRKDAKDTEQISDLKRKLSGDRRQKKDQRKREFFIDPKYKRVELEPSVDSVVDYLVKCWVGDKIFNILQESKLSEFAARAIHLEGSYQEFSRKNKQVKFKYMKSVHESVDTAIREVFASKLLWKEE